MLSQHTEDQGKGAGRKSGNVCYRQGNAAVSLQLAVETTLGNGIPARTEHSQNGQHEEFRDQPWQEQEIREDNHGEKRAGSEIFQSRNVVEQQNQQRISEKAGHGPEDYGEGGVSYGDVHHIDKVQGEETGKYVAEEVGHLQHHEPAEHLAVPQRSPGDMR